MSKIASETERSTMNRKNDTLGEDIPALGVFPSKSESEKYKYDPVFTVRQRLSNTKFSGELDILSKYLKKSSNGINRPDVDVKVTLSEFSITAYFPEVPDSEQQRTDEVMKKLHESRDDPESLGSIIQEFGDLGVATASALNRKTLRPSGSIEMVMPMLDTKDIKDENAIIEEFKDYKVTEFNLLGPFTTHYIPYGAKRKIVAPYEVARQQVKIVGYVSAPPPYTTEQSYLWHVWLIFILESGDIALGYCFGVRDGMIRPCKFVSPEIGMWRGIILSQDYLYHMAFREMSDDDIRHFASATGSSEKMPSMGMSTKVASLVFGYPDKLVTHGNEEKWLYTLNKSEFLGDYLVFENDRLIDHSSGMNQTYGYMGLWPRFPAPAP